MLNETRTNAQQIRETSQGFFVSNTSCRTVETSANWPTHRKPAMRRDNPIPNLSILETPMSKRMKVREITTLIHVSSLPAIGKSLLEFCMNVREIWNFGWAAVMRNIIFKKERSSAPPLLPTVRSPSMTYQNIPKSKFRIWKLRVESGTWELARMKPWEQHDSDSNDLQAHEDSQQKRTASEILIRQPEVSLWRWKLDGPMGSTDILQVLHTLICISWHHSCQYLEMSLSREYLGDLLYHIQILLES